MDPTCHPRSPSPLSSFRPDSQTPRPYRELLRIHLPAATPSSSSSFGDPNLLGNYGFRALIAEPNRHDSICAKPPWSDALDEMGSKIDELEQSVNDLKAEMGATEAPAKKPDEAKPADSA